MKKVFFLLLTVVSIQMILPQNIYAQQTKSEKKTERKAKIEEESNKRMNAIAKNVEGRHFTYTVTELLSIPKASIPRIKLSGIYNLVINGNSLKCYLPIYGTTPNSPRPSMINAIDIVTEDYKMNVIRNKGGLTIDIETLDPRTNTKYFLKLNMPAKGFNTTLRVSTNLDSPIVFNGEIKN